MADDGAMGGMRGKANAALLETACLYGANASWVEEMQARYASAPNSVMRPTSPAAGLMVPAGRAGTGPMASMK